MLSKIKKFLGTLTDLLLVGRSRGWWARKPSAGDVFRDELHK